MNLIVLREKFSKNSTIIELEKIIQEKNLTNIGLVLKSIVKEDKNNLLKNTPMPSPLAIHQESPIQLNL